MIGQNQRHISLYNHPTGEYKRTVIYENGRVAISMIHTKIKENAFPKSTKGDTKFSYLAVLQ